MKPLREIIAEGETWLVERIIDYAKRDGYAAFTSTLEAPWRASIRGLSAPMIAALDRSQDEAEMNAGLASVSPAVAAFVAREARLHRERGVERDFYVALLDCYRRTYLDLLHARGDGAQPRQARLDFIDRFFDHVNTATHAAWGAIEATTELAEARAKNLELTNEKNRLLTVVESIGDPVMLLDRDGALDYANHAAIDIFSAEPVLVGEGYYGVPRVPLLADRLAEFVAVRTPPAQAQLLQTRRGPRYFEIDLRPMRDLSEKFAGTVVVLHDVTAAREAIDAIEAANRAKTAFFATISHEIRAPINAVIGISRLLSQDDLDPRQREYIDAIVASGEALSAVVDDVLDYARIEAGGPRVADDPFDLRRLIREVADLFALRAPQFGSELAISLPTGLPERVTGDAAKLRRILMNFVDNAFRHAPASRISISVRRDGDLWRISVSDNGPGVPDTLRPLLFEPFAQAHGGAGGAGLGLAIARKLAEAIGGEIGCDSVEGEGSTFWLEARLPPSEAPARAPAPPALAPMHVLLVEDSRVDRLVAEGYLQRDGHAVDVATDGVEALALLERREFDLVVMDLRLCGASGLETIRAIRSLDDPRLSTVAIVVLTSDPAAEEAETCRSAGADALIGKPFHPDRLRAATREAVGRAAARRAEAAVDAPLIDPDVLRAHRERLGDAHAYRIVDAFMSAAPTTMERLLRAAEAGDADGVAEFAHHLRGAATFVGLGRLSAAAARLERAAAALAPEVAAREARAIAKVLDRSVAALAAATERKGD